MQTISNAWRLQHGAKLDSKSSLISALAIFEKCEQAVFFYRVLNAKLLSTEEAFVSKLAFVARHQFINLQLNSPSLLRIKTVPLRSAYKHAEIIGYYKIIYIELNQLK